MWESIVFLAFWFLVFGVGPGMMLMGVIRKHLLLVFFGCVLCWGAMVATVAPSMSVVFNSLSIIPVFVYACISTYALVWALGTWMSTRMAKK